MNRNMMNNNKHKFRYIVNCGLLLGCFLVVASFFSSPAQADFSDFWAGWGVSEPITNGTSGSGCPVGSNRINETVQTLTVNGCSAGGTGGSEGNSPDGAVILATHTPPTFSASTSSPITLDFNTLVTVSATLNKDPTYAGSDRAINAYFTYYPASGPQVNIPLSDCSGTAPSTSGVAGVALNCRQPGRYQIRITQNLGAGSKFIFWIRPQNRNSTNITSQLIVSDFSATPAPSDIRISRQRNGRLDFSWTPSSFQNQYYSGYVVKRSLNLADACSPSPGGNTCSIIGLSDGQLYTNVGVFGGFDQTFTYSNTFISLPPGTLIGSYAPPNDLSLGDAASLWTLSTSEANCATSDSTPTNSQISGTSVQLRACNSQNAGTVSAKLQPAQSSGTVTLWWNLTEYYAPAIVGNPDMNTVRASYRVNGQLPQALTTANGTNASCGAPNQCFGVDSPSPALYGSASVVLNKGDTLEFILESPYGMSAGQNYSAYVNGTSNRVDPVALLTVNPIFPFSKPDSPTNVTATAGMGAASVSWTPPTFDGGYPVTSYNVTATPQPTRGTGGCTATPPMTSCNVMDLEGGVSYSFNVVANNFAGASTPSIPSAQTTPATYSMPLIMSLDTGKVGSGSIRVNILPPASLTNDNPGIDAGITQFKAVAKGSTAQSLGSGNQCIAPRDGIKAVSCIISGLANGQSYTVSVIAMDDNQKVSFAAISTPVSPYTVPDAPRNINVTSGNSVASINWAPPLVDGGSPVVGYEVTLNPRVNSAALGPDCMASVPFTGCNVVGVTPGTFYNASVSAVNMAGTGSSLTSAPFTPNSNVVPRGPTGVMTTAKNRSVTVRWNIIPNTGTDAIYQPITSYTALAMDGSGSCTAYPPPEGSTQSTGDCTINGLVNGKTYAFQVYASNAYGKGVYSTPDGNSMATPFTIPDSPENVVAIPGLNNQIVATWAPPQTPNTNGGAPILSYKASAYPKGSVKAAGTCMSAGNIRNCAINDLDTATQYVVLVTATNMAGDSIVSRASLPVTPPTYEGPSIPVIIPGIPSLIPAVPLDIPPIPKDGPSIPCILPAIPGLDARLLDNCTPLGPFSLFASGSSSALVTPNTPNVPYNTIAMAGNGQATIGWQAPLGPTVSSYRVTGSDGSSCMAPADETMCTVNGLINGKTYTFMVTATTTTGDALMGMDSNPVIPVDPSAVPDMVTGVSATDGIDAISVSWISANDPGPQPLLGYTVTANDSSGLAQSCSVNAPATVCNLTGLSPSTTYSVSVVAKNVVGSSPPTTITTTTRGDSSASTTPCPPTSVTAKAGNGSALVSFIPGCASPDDTSVVRSPSGSTCIVKSPATSCEMPGLENGEPVSFTVITVNSNGSSMASPASNTVTPMPSDQQVTGVKVLVGSRVVKVTWDPPTGSIKPKEFIVRTAPGGRVCKTKKTSCTFRGLPSGRSYVFFVDAVYSKGMLRSSSGTTAIKPQKTQQTQAISLIAKPLLASKSMYRLLAAGGNGSGLITYTAKPTEAGITCNVLLNVLWIGNQNPFNPTNPASGGCIVTARKAGDPFYLPQLSQDVTVLRTAK